MEKDVLHPEGRLRRLGKKSSKFLRSRYEEETLCSTGSVTRPDFGHLHRDKTGDPWSQKEIDYVGAGGRLPPIFPEIPQNRSIITRNPGIGGPEWEPNFRLGSSTGKATLQMKPTMVESKQPSAEPNDPRSGFVNQTQPFKTRAPIGTNSGGGNRYRSLDEKFLKGKNAPSRQILPASNYTPPSIPDVFATGQSPPDSERPLPGTLAADHIFRVAGFRQELRAPKRMPPGGKKLRPTFDLKSPDSDDSEDERPNVIPRRPDNFPESRFPSIAVAPFSRNTFSGPDEAPARSDIATVTLKQRAATSPFDDADDERRRAWRNAENSLTRTSDSPPPNVDQARLESDVPLYLLEMFSQNSLPRIHSSTSTDRNFIPFVGRNEDSYSEQRSSVQMGNGIDSMGTRPKDPDAFAHQAQKKAQDKAQDKAEEWAKASRANIEQSVMGSSGFVMNKTLGRPLVPLQVQNGRAPVTLWPGPPVQHRRAPTPNVSNQTYHSESPATIQQKYRPLKKFSPDNSHGLPPFRPLPPLPSRSPTKAAPLLKRKKSGIFGVSFLEGSLPVSEFHFAKMDSKLQVRPSEFSSVKSKAVEDARQMQATVIEDANKTGKDPPKYALLELIGKGSFGRVYKGKDMTSAAIVAVKIIDIDESDTLNPRLANSYSEFLKEVNALKILSESNARNINHVIEALPVGKSMWMITEHCGGGSVATLMRPTAPGGLQEKWIVPILREVAEGLKWIHQAGIIHRDIKCANVLITEQGGVQVCDFGVAGIIENKVDKRSTVIGTPHWMAPELFDSNPSYGKEIDIWAFGSMVFEIATGLPPNAKRISFGHLGTHLKQHVPRLEGGNYSNDLRNLVAYCLEELPTSRPTIEQVQRHPYINNTSSKYPASSLSSLVRAFKMWEDHGGSRKSLFMMGGAQGPSELSSSIADDEWNFSTTAAFDQEVLRKSTPADVFDAYGNDVALDGFFNEETTRPSKASKRRPPPEALNRLPAAPLEKIFDPNTMSSYEDNSRNHYGRMMQPPASDLPLRDDTAHTSIRDTLIDLGGDDDLDAGFSHVPDMDTIKASKRTVQDEVEDDYTSTLHDFSRPALSDPADVNPNRRTQDWKFPSMVPPASADPETSRFPATYDLPKPTITPGSGGPLGRPPLVHHPTEPVGAPFAGSLMNAQPPPLERLSMRESLIDLDMSLPETISSFVPSFASFSTRPSTANSDAGSSTSEQVNGGSDPFDLQHHALRYRTAPSLPPAVTEAESYLNEETASALRDRSNGQVRDINEVSDFSASDAESQDTSTDGKYDAFSDSDIPLPPQPFQSPFPRLANKPYTFNHFPGLPAPPSENALSGLASNDEMKDELTRMLGSMTSQLEAFRDVYAAPQVASRRGPTPNRRDRKDGGATKGAPLNGTGAGGGTSSSG